MKKILIAMCAVATMASCSQNELLDINESNPNLISFDTYWCNYTRATEASVDNIKSTGGFGVWSKTTTNSWSGSSLFINNENVKWGDAWTTDRKYYWPSNDALDFVAYYPYNKDAVLTNNILTCEEIVTTAANQKDILVSTVLTSLNSGNGTNGAVSFTMSHVLSQVDFKIAVEEGSNVSVIINSFEIQGVNTTHSGLDLVKKSILTSTEFTPSFDTNYTYGESKTFTPQTINQSGSVTLSGVEDNGVFMLLPQKLSPWNVTKEPTNQAVNPGARIVMNYTYKINDVTIFEDKDAAFPLSGTWDPSTKYLYTLTFSDTSGGGYEPYEPENPDTKPEIGDPILGYLNSPLLDVAGRDSAEGH